MICCPECPNGHSVICRDCPFHKKPADESPVDRGDEECPDDNDFLDSLEEYELEES